MYIYIYRYYANVYSIVTIITTIIIATLCLFCMRTVLGNTTIDCLYYLSFPN